MKLVNVALVAVAYVLGTKAGHERYAQIVKVAEKASRRLDHYGAREDAERLAGDRGDGDPRRQEAPL